MSNCLDCLCCAVHVCILREFDIDRTLGLSSRARLNVRSAGAWVFRIARLFFLKQPLYIPTRNRRNVCGASDRRGMSIWKQTLLHVYRDVGTLTGCCGWQQQQQQWQLFGWGHCPFGNCLSSLTMAEAMAECTSWKRLSSLGRADRERRAKSCYRKLKNWSFARSRIRLQSSSGPRKKTRQRYSFLWLSIVWLGCCVCGKLDVMGWKTIITPSGSGGTGGRQKRIR